MDGGEGHDGTARRQDRCGDRRFDGNRVGHGPSIRGRRAHVYVTGRRQEQLDAAVAAIGAQATGVQGDIAEQADLDRLYEKIAADGRRIDVLFANAGVGEIVPLAEMTESTLTTSLT
ncbi:SDR family NAD(P)-dependent oxidoreductase [Amycolatopsis sp. NPDC049253]|uniref:SDR family NAD(P)-dependent oxidoreductase n=1 Tax=Amycolatopsis sp. NPDC049253 TaxID=3155274 RepID=UPI003425EAA1